MAGWYARACLSTGSISGWNEAANLRGLPIAVLLHRAAAVNWLHAVDAVFNSYVWFGGWSFLTLRSWIYRIFAALFLYAAVRGRSHFAGNFSPQRLCLSRSRPAWLTTSRHLCESRHLGLDGLVLLRRAPRRHAADRTPGRFADCRHRLCGARSLRHEFRRASLTMQGCCSTSRVAE